MEKKKEMGFFANQKNPPLNGLTVVYIVSKRWFDDALQNEKSAPPIDNGDLLCYNEEYDFYSLLKSQMPPFYYFSRNIYKMLVETFGMKNKKHVIKRAVIVGLSYRNKNRIDMQPVYFYFSVLIEDKGEKENSVYIKKVFSVPSHSYTRTLYEKVKKYVNLSYDEFGIHVATSPFVLVENNGLFPVLDYFYRAGVNVIDVRIKSKKETDENNQNSQKNEPESKNCQQAPAAPASIVSNVASNVAPRQEAEDSRYLLLNYTAPVGFYNLGNTCYMNSALQIIFSVQEFFEYFGNGRHSPEINYTNPLSSKGKIANAFAELYRTRVDASINNSHAVSPVNFKTVFSSFNSLFAGYAQHDAQEFLSALLDSLHEDLNRIKNKPYTELPDFDNSLTDEHIAERFWSLHKSRNDSIIVDLFHGQFKSTLSCPICSNTSKSFDPLCFLPLPLPTVDTTKVIVKLLSYDLFTEPKYLVFHVQINMNLGEVLLRALEKFNVNVNHVWLHHSLQRNIPGVFKNISEYFNFDAVSNSIMDSSDPKKFEEMGYLLTKEHDITLYLIKEEHDNPEYTPMLIRHRSVSSDNIYGEFLLPSMVVLVPRRLGDKLHISEFKKIIYTRLFEFKCQSLFNYKSYIQKRMISSLEDANEESSSSTPNTNTGNVDEVMRFYAMHQRHTDTVNVDELSMIDPQLCAFKVRSTYSDLSDDTEISIADNPVVDVIWTNFCHEKVFSVGDLHKTNQEAFLQFTTPYSSVYSANTSVTNIPVEILTKHRRNSIEWGLDDCMSLFSQAEVLSEYDSWFCKKCKDSVRACKKMDIWQLPQILIINFNRYQHSGFTRSKVKRNVNYPVKGLDLTKYVQSNKTGEQYIYDLFGVVNHYGSLTFGHYTAYAKHVSTGVWHHYNDSRCVKVERKNEEDKDEEYIQNGIINENAYVLIYRRRTN